MQILPLGNAQSAKSLKETRWWFEVFMRGN